jgi:CheY-like chemotaxis protein
MAPTSKETKILIIEDDPFLSELASSRFRQEGFDTFIALNGEEGIKTMKSVLPDIVLLDIIMPVMNGFDTLEKIKADEQIRHIPVIIFSNLAQADDMRRATALGAEGFLVKANNTPKDIVRYVREKLGIVDEVSPPKSSPLNG